MNKLKKTACLYGFLSGLIVFICGFFTLNIMYIVWKAQNPGSALRSLYGYKAACIGDPLCLPMIIGSLTARNILTKDKPKKWQKNLCCIIGGAGALTGLIIQLSWLISDSTELNWTIPALHRFNIPGWEHFIFFIAMIGVIMFLLFKKTFYTEKNETFSRNVLMLDFLTAFGGSFFIQLHTIDEYCKLGDSVKILIISSLLLLVFLVSLQTVQIVLMKKSKYSFTKKQIVLSYLVILTANIISCFVSLLIQ